MRTRRMIAPHLRPRRTPRVVDRDAEINRCDLSPLYDGRTYADDPAEAARPVRPQRVGVLDPLGGLRKAS